MAFVDDGNHHGLGVLLDPSANSDFGIAEAVFRGIVQEIEEALFQQVLTVNR